MANNPLESADKKYYAAKAPLYLRGTREGRKRPPNAFSYKQKGNDATASSNKYYASPEQVPPVSQEIPRLQKDVVLRFKALDSILQDAVSAFQTGATIVEVTGNGEEISKARAKVDMAVGRNTLTREQANAITFITTLDEPGTTVEEKPKVPKKKATKKKTTRKKEKKSKDPDVDALLSSPPSDVETRSAGLKNVRKEDDGITESDVAKAFGVSDDDDDDDSDD